MRMKSGSRLLLAGLFLALSAPAFAIYKCEADGKFSYSDTLCPNGKTLDLAVSVSDAASARQQASQEKRALQHLENDRHKREARDEKEQQRAAHAYANRQKKCAALARKRKWADEDLASAKLKSIEKAKRKSRRLTEQYDAQCSA